MMKVLVMPLPLAFTTLVVVGLALLLRCRSCSIDRSQLVALNAQG